MELAFIFMYTLNYNLNLMNHILQYTGIIPK